MIYSRKHCYFINKEKSRKCIWDACIPLFIELCRKTTNMAGHLTRQFTNFMLFLSTYIKMFCRVVFNNTQNWYWGTGGSLCNTVKSQGRGVNLHAPEAKQIQSQGRGPRKPPSTWGQTNIYKNKEFIPFHAAGSGWKMFSTDPDLDSEESSVCTVAC